MINLDDLAIQLVDGLPEILDDFGIEYCEHHNRLSMPCPVHGGDNPEGCSVFIDGQTAQGNWVCFTHHCELNFDSSIFGFFRGILSHLERREVDFGYMLKWASDFLKLETSTPASIAQHKDRKQFANFCKKVSTTARSLRGTVPRSKVRRFLQIPAEYYLERGYSKAVLEKYDVGFCNHKKSRMFLRVVVPVYDDNYTMIGCVGRTVQPKCNVCGYHHYDNRGCPTNKIEKRWASKWKNSDGFNASHYFYNLWEAKPTINKSGLVILVEGQGDVWRLEEAGIHNSLGLFGDELSDGQQCILEQLNVRHLVLATDNDLAGISAREKITDQCSRLFNVYEVSLPKHDVGQLTVQETRDVFLPIVEKLNGK